LMLHYCNVSVLPVPECRGISQLQKLPQNKTECCFPQILKSWMSEGITVSTGKTTGPEETNARAGLRCQSAYIAK